MTRPSGPFTVAEGRLRVVPVCHYRFEFAHCVRRAILAHRPAAVAVELPPGLREAFLRAVRRFPRLSVVSYESEDGEVMLLPVEPTDPFAEAVRTALDCGIPVHFVDLNVHAYPLVLDPMPDAYAVFQIGLDRYWETYATTVAQRPRVALDAPREVHMAAEVGRLLEAHPSGEVLLVCGMAHARPVLDAVREGAAELAAHSPMRNVAVNHPDAESVREIAAEMPFLMVIYEWLRSGPGPDDTWELEAEPEPAPPSDDRPTLEAVSQDDLLASLESMLGMARQRGQEIPPLSPEQMRALARHLSSIPDPRLRFGFGEASNAPPGLTGAPASTPESHRIFKFRNCSDRRPDLKAFYASCATRRREQDGMLDRQRMAMRMLEKAAEFYTENSGEKFHHWQMRTLVRFARSYARLTGQLLPDFWQWMIAARGVSDDNYGYEVWDLGSFYPWQRDDDDEPTIRIHADEVWMADRKITFRRRFPRFRERFVKPPVRQRKNEAQAGDWVKEFNRGAICSYPPEDILIEDYGLYLKKKALLVLSEERTRTEPFATSLLDGIDVRETIRNWPDGHRLYVREIQKVSGGAGSVVIIFDEDDEDTRYPWKMTWHGEHEQESDMAFYATPMGSKIVGPGIARCEYGGLMLTYPPRRVMDVWTDPFYAEAQSKAEVLLLAALEYSKEKHVVYVSAKPPRSFFRSLAARVGRKVVYLPIGQLSPVSIKKIRVFHVLSGHHLREVARDYIW